MSHPFSLLIADNEVWTCIKASGEAFAKVNIISGGGETLLSNRLYGLLSRSNAR